jgi:hypothetical protein
MAGVQLDGGEDSLTGRSGGSKRSSNSHGGSSIGSGETSIGSGKMSSGESSNSRGGMSNVSNNGTRGGSINTTEKTSTNTVGTSIRVRKDSGGSDRGSFLISITPLPFSSLLGGSSSSGGGSLVSSSKLSLGSSNFRSILDSNWEGEVENGSSKRFDSESSRADREVSSGNSESIDRVSNVVHSLEETISIDVLVRAGGHSVGIAGLSTG